MMRWYWPISCDNTVANPFVASEGELGLEESLLRQGHTIRGWSKTAWIQATTPDDDGEPDDVLQSFLGLPIFSPRLRTALSKQGLDDIQYLSIRVLHSDGAEIPDFAIANIVTVRDALDRQQSDYSTFADDYPLADRRGKISAIRKPVFVGERLEGCDIVRLEGYRVAYYVSERFKSIFERGSFTGYSFREIQVV